MWKVGAMLLYYYTFYRMLPSITKCDTYCTIYISTQKYAIL